MIFLLQLIVFSNHNLTEGKMYFELIGELKMYLIFKRKRSDICLYVTTRKRHLTL